MLAQPVQSTALVLFALQVLAQLHGVTSDGDAEDEQQEDLAPSSQGKEHRRPHSAGNLAEQAATSSSSSSHRTGRPPLAETTANNKLGLKVHIHLFTPSLPPSPPHPPTRSLTRLLAHSGVTRPARQPCSYLDFRICRACSCALLAFSQQHLHVTSTGTSPPSLHLCPILSCALFDASDSARHGRQATGAVVYMYNSCLYTYMYRETTASAALPP